MLRTHMQHSILRRQLPVRKFSRSSVTRRFKLAYDLHLPQSSTPREEHQGNAIVFMHGLFGSKKNNRSMSKILARDLNRPVYAIDLRNHGESPHDPRHDYTVLTEDVLDFLDTHGLAEPTIIGHSMGSKTAMAVALHSPDRVANIVSVDNAPVDAALHSDFAKYVQGMRKIEDMRVKSQSEADKILTEYEENLAIRQFLLTNLVNDKDAQGSYRKFRIPLKYLGAALDNMADFPYKDPDQVRFEKPALFVRGSGSKYVADETLPIIGRFFPLFKLVDVDAGHWVISENPQAFREAVVEFLQEQR